MTTSVSISLPALKKDEVYNFVGSYVIEAGVKDLGRASAIATCVSAMAWCGPGNRVGGSAYVSFYETGGSLTLNLTFSNVQELDGGVPSTPMPSSGAMW